MKEKLLIKKKERLNYQKVAPNAFKGLIELDKYVQASNIGDKLYELVKMRASQINGCAYCLDMHSKDARAGGETEQRLYGLNAWRETPFYSERERAALAWTEALTEISINEVSDELYESVREYFDEEEMVALTMLIIAINGWNRLAIPFRTEPGSYKPELDK
ncbi:MAG TPA: carboxymuconolactone decarboxylase family protein [Fodinibius sp.]|nr:carboxymuconolactone decarboxylase family protein [Fodinibius sp.]